MSKLLQKHKWLGSSADPNKVGLTVRGAVLTAIPILVMVIGGFGITLDPDLLVQFVNTLFGVITSVMVLVGLGRKIYYSLN